MLSAYRKSQFAEQAEGAVADCACSNSGSSRGPAIHSCTIQ